MPRNTRRQQESTLVKRQTQRATPLNTFTCTVGSSLLFAVFLVLPKRVDQLLRIADTLHASAKQIERELLPPWQLLVRALRMCQQEKKTESREALSKNLQYAICKKLLTFNLPCSAAFRGIHDASTSKCIAHSMSHGCVSGSADGAANCMPMVMFLMAWAFTL